MARNSHSNLKSMRVRVAHPRADATQKYGLHQHMHRCLPSEHDKREAPAPLEPRVRTRPQYEPAHTRDREYCEQSFE